MTTHTPGPWRLELANSGARIAADKDTHICAALAGNRANARLIAAAPEMLAALKEVVRFVDSVGSEHINRVPFAAARAAIAKAEGSDD